MKHLKYFEKIDDSKKYWIIDTKQPNLEISLLKIGMTDPRRLLIQTSLILRSNDNKNKDKILITYKFEDMLNKLITRNSFYNSIAYSTSNEVWLLHHDYKNMGDIKITNDDIENYNIKKDSDTYNL